MSAKILSDRRHVEVVEYRHIFSWEDTPSAGFSFECTSDGKVLDDDWSSLAKENYRACLAGNLDGQRLLDEGIVKYVRQYVEPAIAECRCCGNEVPLAREINTCDFCETDYNCFGQELAPQKYWEENEDIECEY